MMLVYCANNGFFLSFFNLFYLWAFANKRNANSKNNFFFFVHFNVIGTEYALIIVFGLCVTWKLCVTLI